MVNSAFGPSSGLSYLRWPVALTRNARPTGSQNLAGPFYEFGHAPRLKASGLPTMPVGGRVVGARNPDEWCRARALRGSPAPFLALAARLVLPLRRPCSRREPLSRTCHYPAQPVGTEVGVSRAIAINGRPVNIDISAINGIGSRCRPESRLRPTSARHADWAMWILGWAILRPMIPLKRCQSVAAAARSPLARRARLRAARATGLRFIRADRTALQPTAKGKVGASAP